MATFKELRKRMYNTSKNISELTGVDQDMVINILQYAKQIAIPDYPDRIDEAVFMAQLSKRFGITSRLIVHLIFDYMKVKSMKYMRVEDYTRMVCIFCTDRLPVKVDFVFNVYDFNRKGFLNHAEMFKLLENSVHVPADDDPTSHVKELVEIVINLIDVNCDGQISIEEFRRCVNRDIQYLELFGQALPAAKETDKFMQILIDKSPQKVADHFRNERTTCLCEPIIHRRRDSLYSVDLDLP